ncbi:MAG TPA: hypothetical protein DEO84_04410 [candidate division Zixibacteria bacterium]|nr:hypothetical protein [candidate division Zixibacteria bacterium]
MISSKPIFSGFNLRPLGRKGDMVTPIGLAGSGIGHFRKPPYDVYKWGLNNGINLFMWVPPYKNMTKSIVELPAQRRSELFIVSGVNRGGPKEIRDKVYTFLKTLKIEKLPCLLLFWVTSESRVREPIIEELVRLRDEGLCDNIGLSTHNRKMANELYTKNIFDIFMLRYNAAHRGLEQDFFDKLDSKRLPGVITYTSTRWNKLLRRPSSWNENLPRPGDLYRFPLSHQFVTATWMSPGNIEELKANLTEIAEGPLKPEEDRFIRRFGDRVHESKSWGITNFFERSSRY